LLIVLDWACRVPLKAPVRSVGQQTAAGSIALQRFVGGANFS